MDRIVHYILVWYQLWNSKVLQMKLNFSTPAGTLYMCIILVRWRLWNLTETFQDLQRSVKYLASPINDISLINPGVNPMLDYIKDHIKMVGCLANTMHWIKVSKKQKENYKWLLLSCRGDETQFHKTITVLYPVGLAQDCNA